MTALNIMKNGGITTLATIFHQNMYRFILNSRLTSSTFGVGHCKSTNVDALDIFTTNILAKKNVTPVKSIESTEAINTDRSKLVKKVIPEIQSTFNSKPTLNIGSLNQSEIDNYLIVSIDCGDRKKFNEIIEQIIISKSLPSEALILRALCHLCDDSDHSMLTISRFIDVCQEMNIAFYAKNMEFAPFLSQYLWKFERYDDAMNTLNSIYGTTNKITKSLILRNYRQIIYDCIKNQNENILDKMIISVTKIYEIHKDSTLLNYVWRDCFFSELFRNQQIANELFEKYNVIRQTICKDIGWIALTLLQQHNTDAVHRLIEQCIAENMKREIEVCLTALFDYHCE